MYLLDQYRRCLKVTATAKSVWYVCCLVLAVATAVLAAATETTTSTVAVSKNLNDFIVYNTLEDGEAETRVTYKGVTAKEITVGRRLGVKFRQLTDGKHFIQLIYDEENKINDCEYVHEPHSVAAFIDTFRQDIQLLTTLYNATIVPLDNVAKLPQEMQQWMNYKRLKQQCKDVHREIKKLLKDRRKTVNNTTRNRRDLREYLLFPGTLWCGHSDAAPKTTSLGLLTGTDRCCRKHDMCQHIVPGFTKKYGLLNLRPFTIVSCRCDNRNRRDIGDYLRIPGTKWCGKGRSATKYTDVGMFSTTDKCCRRHDSACPFWISGFETKYGLFNWRVNTIMHCQCDERFRTCLKRVGTSDANLVGKLFFNVVQKSCFVFKPVKTCTKHTWWGKCAKYKYVKQAVIKENMSY